jgi:hypothetical protein
MDSTGNSSNNEDKNFDQDKYLEQIRDQVNEEFQPEADKALADLRKAADAVVKSTASEHQQLGLIRDAADDLDLRNQPDDALRELLDEAREALNADDSHDIDGGQRFTVRRSQDVMPGFIKQGAFHMLNAEQGAGKSCFCLGLFRALVSDEQTASFLNVEVDSSTNWRLFLIAPDMPKESWALPLANYGFAALTSQVGNELEEFQLDSRIAKLRTMETGYSLSPRHIEMYRDWALKAQEAGERALFVFDSYSSLVANFTQIDEVKAAFAQPLQNLQKAMADTGATTIVLHHTAKGGSSSVASSGTGTGRLGRIPDVVIAMEALNKNSDQLILTSSKRIASTCLLVQQDFDAGQWISHGDGRKAQRDRELYLKIAALRGTPEAVHEKAQDLWEHQKRGFTSKQVEIWTGKSATTARNTINAMLAQGLLFQIGEEQTVGRPLKVFLPMICRDEWTSATSATLKTPLTQPDKPTAAEGIDPLNNFRNQESEEKGQVAKVAKVAKGSGIIPCHPIDSIVKIKGGGVGTWKVIEANLATGMHVLQSENTGVQKRDLRMMDLEPFIDEDEVL